MVASGPYRAARRLRQLALVAAVVLVAFVGTLAYSASQIRPSSTLDTAHEALLANGTLVLGAFLNISNPGPFPVDPVDVSASVYAPDGTPLANARGANVAIGAGGTTTIHLRLYFPLEALRSASSILTVSENLTAVSLVNATIGSLVSVVAEYDRNLSWGAPFDALTVTVSAPAPGPNRTTVANSTVSFTDQAAFPIAGNLVVTLVATGGVACGSAPVPAQVLRGAAFSRTVAVPLTAGCDPLGGTADISLHEPTFVLDLPSEPIP